MAEGSDYLEAFRTGPVGKLSSDEMAILLSHCKNVYSAADADDDNVAINIFKEIEEMIAGHIEGGIVTYGGSIVRQTMHGDDGELKMTQEKIYFTRFATGESLEPGPTVEMVRTPLRDVELGEGAQSRRWHVDGANAFMFATSQEWRERHLSTWKRFNNASHGGVYTVIVSDCPKFLTEYTTERVKFPTANAYYATSELKAPDAGASAGSVTPHGVSAQTSTYGDIISAVDTPHRAPNLSKFPVDKARYIVKVHLTGRQVQADRVSADGQRTRVFNLRF